MSTEGFIKNEKVLKEDSKVEDFLDFTELIKNFEKKLDEINNPSIIGLVGKFGSGKSTMLHQIKKKREDNEIWIDFDAWKYPDRKNLWEGFVLDFARQIDNKSFDKILKEIDGKKGDDKKTLINVISCIPGLSVVKNLKHFVSSSPARRTFEVQNILNDMIKKEKKDIYIVIEDIDRSGDAGIFFLETLKQYMRDLEIGHNIIAIVPIGNKNYHDKLDSYHKCLDYVEFFNPKVLNLEKFVESVIKNNFLNENAKSQVASFFEEYLKTDENMTLRLMKLILRNANVAYINQEKDGHEPDWRVTICIETSKYFKIYNSTVVFHEDFKVAKNVPSNTIYASFIFTIMNKRSSIYDKYGLETTKKRYNPGKNFDFFTRRANDSKKLYPSTPYVERGSGMFFLCDFYLDY